MLTNFKTEEILNQKDVEEIIKLENSLKTEFKTKYYNLYNVDYSHVNSEYRKKISGLIKLEEYAKRHVHSHYILTYYPGSWARVHIDDESKSELTIVTHLESNNLVGGHSLFYDEQMPLVVDLEPPRSLVYDFQVQHGVTKVFSGTRKVLISWFGKPL